jgi:hypothetical protein
VPRGVTAIAAVFLVPNTPVTTRWLSKQESELAENRMIRDRLLAHEHELRMTALANAVRDPLTWLFCLIQNFHYVGLSFINFLPTLVRPNTLASR